MPEYLSMCCDEVKMREVTANICRDFLKGQWKTISPEDLEFRRISGGLSNYLYYVALPDRARWPPAPPQSAFSLEEPRKVLVRIYGQTQSERGVDNIIMDSVIFALLSERRLGPKLHGVFSGGRIEEYIGARTLKTRELSEPALSMKIAEKMAAIHKMDVPLCKVPQWMWRKMDKWLRASLQHLQHYKPKNDKEAKGINKMREYKLEKEVAWLRDYLSTVDSPVVFCHNDLQEGNILLREEEIPHNDETNDDLNIDYSSVSSESLARIASQSDADMRSASGEEDLTTGHGDLAAGQNRLATGRGDLPTGPSRLSTGHGDPTTRQKHLATGSEDLTTGQNRLATGQLNLHPHLDEDCATNDSIISKTSEESDNGEPKLVLIDYEYCSYNHRGFDLANHFVEWAYDYTNPEEPYYYEIFDHYPTLEQKEIFMRQYLLTMEGEVHAEQVNRLNSEVDAFTLASHLFWALWAVVHGANSQIPFGYWDYGVSRMEWYGRLKAEIIKKGSVGGNSLKRKIVEVDI